MVLLVESTLVVVITPLTLCQIQMLRLFFADEYRIREDIHRKAQLDAETAERLRQQDNNDALTLKYLMVQQVR